MVEVVGGKVVFGIEDTSKVVGADEVNMRGQGMSFAGLSNGRSFVMKIWFLYHAHIDNRVLRSRWSSYRVSA